MTIELCVEARINRASLLVLVDNGASHNFVTPQVFSSLDLRVDYSKKLAVRLGDGHCVFTICKCSKVPLQIGELSIIVDAYILDWPNYDHCGRSQWIMGR